MSTLDIILTSIIVIGAIRGFIKGFIFEIAVLGTLFVLYFLGFKLAGIAAVYIGKVIHVNPDTLRYISLFVTWIGVSIGIFFLARLFEGLVNIVALGIFNKIAGAIFGGLKYAFIISLLLFFLNRFNISFSWINSDAKAESHLYYPILRIAKSVLPLTE